MNDDQRRRKFDRITILGQTSRESGCLMDLMVTGVVAIIIAIIAALIALIKRKKIGKILMYALSGLIIGLLVGYILAPDIISFF